MGAEEGKYTLVAKANGTVAADTLIIKGTREGTASAVVDTIVLTDGANSFTMHVDGTNRVYWTDIDSVAYDRVDGALSIQLEAIPFANVKASGGATTDFAGVVTEAIAVLIVTGKLELFTREFLSVIIFKSLMVEPLVF